MAEKVMQKA